MRCHRTAIVAVAALAAAGCGAAGAADKSGGPETTVTLRLGTQDRAPFPSAKVLTRFAADVRRRSHGRLRIAITYQAAGLGSRSADQAAARLVRSGRFDLGFFPARAWDVDGGTSLRALQAPFLLQSTEQAARVLADDELAGTMLAGLRPLGLTGLALLPGGPR